MREKIQYLLIPPYQMHEEASKGLQVQLEKGREFQ